MNKFTLENNLELVSGFYYNSRLLKRDISPIFIDDKNNLETALIIFVNYWFKANTYLGEKGFIRDLKNYKELIENKNKLLSKYK